MASGIPPVRDRRTHFAGRWTALTAVPSRETRDADVEMLARVLLRRYGVVFRRMLTREPAAPPWRELTRVYRRLEARGELRGGRFVSGMSGEQFALPEAVDHLRDVRRTPKDGRLLAISAADPLNLAGSSRRESGFGRPCARGSHIATEYLWPSSKATCYVP